MKILAYASVLAMTLSVGLPMAVQAATLHAKSVVQTTCQDYIAMDETMKPKFIYFAEGHSKKGNPDAVLDITGTEKIKPELDKYCQVNLSKSAYEQVMKTSMASEKTNK